MPERTEVAAIRHQVADMPKRPERPLVTDDLILRLPVLGDREVLARYASDEASLQGAWLPAGVPDIDPETWAAWFASELILGWSPLGGRFGGNLVIDFAGNSFVGLIGLRRRKPTVAEISYGVAPQWRGRGVATRAAALATDWALSAGFDRVEARIDQSHDESRRVIESAGFRYERTCTTCVEGTGQTWIDVLYTRSNEDPPPELAGRSGRD